jgi:hypothetical protein
MVLNGWLSITYESFREITEFIGGLLKGEAMKNVKPKAYFQGRQAK